MNRMVHTLISLTNSTRPASMRLDTASGRCARSTASALSTISRFMQGGCEPRPAAGMTVLTACKQNAVDCRLEDCPCSPWTLVGQPPTLLNTGRFTMWAQHWQAQIGCIPAQILKLETSTAVQVWCRGNQCSCT